MNYHLCVMVLFSNFNLDICVCFSDLIGQIIEISHLEHLNVNGKETEKISLQLRNSE